jgi:hypothetical protein
VGGCEFANVDLGLGFRPAPEKKGCEEGSPPPKMGGWERLEGGQGGGVRSEEGGAAAGGLADGENGGLEKEDEVR